MVNSNPESPTNPILNIIFKKPGDLIEETSKSPEVKGKINTASGFLRSREKRHRKDKLKREEPNESAPEHN